HCKSSPAHCRSPPGRCLRPRRADSGRDTRPTPQSGAGTKAVTLTTMKVIHASPLFRPFTLAVQWILLRHENNAQMRRCVPRELPQKSHWRVDSHTVRGNTMIADAPVFSTTL